jgi:hypothetical protein
LYEAALGAGAIGGGAIWLPGCGGAPPHPALPLDEASALMERLDRGLRSVRSSPFAATAQPWTLREGAAERLVRLGLEALVVADVARSITPGAVVPDALGQRLDEALPILDQCTVAYHALLQNAPPAVRRDIDRRFREEPDIAMRVTEVIDARAAEIGISANSRTRLRAIASNVGTRIRHQSTSAVVDDCAEKIETALGRPGAELRLARGVHVDAMIDAIWQQVEGVPQGGVRGSSLSSPAAPAPQAHDTELAMPAERPHESGPGDPELAVGGTMLGSGLAVFGIGSIITVATGSVWWMVGAATPAGVAVIIGLILLIVGAVQNA